MELEYAGVNLELLTLDRVSRRAVYTQDQADLLYIEWIIGATCVYARGGYPVGTAALDLTRAAQNDLRGSGWPDGGVRGADPNLPVEFPQVANRGAAFFGSAGLNGVETDVDLKTRLWLPRQRFVISAYSTAGQKVVWLESPRNGAPCDAANGPHPLSVDVVDATGDGATLGVHFQIKTCVPPCPAESDRLVLSHRWQMTHAHDENYYLTRIVKGEIVFNGSVVHKYGLRPDAVRSQFIHPIPLGFRRGGPQIVQSSDGLTIGYTIVDTDASVTFDAGDSGATHMDIVEKVSYESPWGV